MSSDFYFVLFITISRYCFIRPVTKEKLRKTISPQFSIFLCFSFENLNYLKKRIKFLFLYFKVLLMFFFVIILCFSKKSLKDFSF